MKLNTIVLASLTGLLTISAHGAAAGGAAGVGPAGSSETVNGAAGAGPVIRPFPAPPNGQLQPVQPGQPPQSIPPAQPQPGQPGETQPQQPGQAAPNSQSGTATNSFANGTDNGAKPSGGQTNQFGPDTNGFALWRTNAGQPTPTAQPGFPNRVFATNNNGTAVSNRTTQLPGDQAISQTDRALLTQIRQTAFPNANAQAGLGGSDSVNFVILNGQVRLVGTVPTMEEKQRIEAIAQQSPGVVKVFNVLQVKAQ
jgi:hypothetical protein